jgi:hypothetical protein
MTVLEGNAWNVANPPAIKKREFIYILLALVFFKTTPRGEAHG